MGLTGQRELLMTKRMLPSLPTPRAQRGRWGYVLAWLVGVPIPILILVYLLRGCT